MTQATVPSYVYTVYTATGCTVTAPGFPSFSVTCYPGMANSFPAPGDKVEISDPAATLVAVRTFNGALAALGLLGGGNTLPAGYTRLEYLEFTGGTIIRLAVPVNNLFGLYFDYEKTLPIRTNDFPISWQKENPYRAFRLVCSETDGVFSWWVSAKNNLKYYAPPECRMLWRANFKNSRKLTADSAEYGHAELALTDVDCDYDEVVFGRIYRLDNKDLSFAAFFKAYAIKLSSGSEVVYDLVPALDETGAPCLYDKVSSTAFYNDGSGDFIYPAATATYARRRVLPDWGKLTPRGLRRLYHVPEGYEGDMLQYAAENGFCPIQEEPQPEEGFWAPKWEEIGGVIYLRWVETAPPEEN